MKKRTKSFYILIYVGIIINLMLILGQTLALIDFDFVVRAGLQDSEEEVGKVGVAFAKGVGFIDTLFYIPLFIFGISGLLKNKSWGGYCMFGALAITSYWPIFHLFTYFTERTAIVLSPEKYIAYPILLSVVTIYGLWGMWYVYKNREGVKK